MRLIDIAFDLDGTLINLMPIFERIIWKNYKVKVVNNRKFNIVTEPKIEYDTIKWCFAEAFKRYEEIEIVPGVRELFSNLYELSDSDPIKIVTARPYNSAEWTYRLAERICKNICEWEVVIVKNSDNKIKHLKRYKHFVDDRRKTVLHLSSHGKTVWMPIKNYNQPMNSHLVNQMADFKYLADKANWFIKEVEVL